MLIFGSRSLREIGGRVKRALLACLAVGLAIINGSHAAMAFTVSDCVTHLSSPDIIPKFRLTQTKAMARCTIIQNRITRLSARMIGSWTRRDDVGHRLSMAFSPDGTAHVRWWNFGSRRLVNDVQKWAIENPYGTVGQEGLELNDGTFTAVAFSGRTITLTSRPADSDIVERWTRVK